ncbi:stalk domain-containing protein [Paenibacillus dokdonensis]|uniref:Stalk domain-containing protein n=1 Tax=Paenibacillus dokdonensis TaxID=2567944 RepID=A0ABU6GTQ0_9BACL|nr:stalk domain-containing protein [Paenibacillus dokdonensis]MEC0242502.1 stalk domain-containing protein [Paenibacillus dokdonensis]
MKKKTVNMIKMSAVGCAALMGVSAASVPVNAMSSVQPSAVVASNVQASAPTAAAVKVNEKVLTTTSTYLTTHIQVPQLTGMLDTHYQAELNDIILSHAEKDLAAWEKEAAETASNARTKDLEFRPYDLYITYNLKADGTGNPAGVISLEVITEGSRGGTSMPRIDTYNVENKATAESVTLSGLLGADYKEKLDADILAQIKKDPNKYFLEDYKGTSMEQTFYLEKGELVIVFPKYSIAPGYVGSPEFRFSLKDHSTAVTKPAETKPEAAVMLDLKKVANYKNTQGATMVSLRDVAHQLGYELKWNQSAKTAEVKKEAQWTSVSIGKDSYFFAKMTPKPLGAAPVLQDNKLYVPVTFVSEILKVQVQ